MTPESILRGWRQRLRADQEPLEVASAEPFESVPLVEDDIKPLPPSGRALATPQAAVDLDIAPSDAARPENLPYRRPSDRAAEKPVVYRWVLQRYLLRCPLRRIRRGGLEDCRFRR